MSAAARSRRSGASSRGADGTSSGRGRACRGSRRGSQDRAGNRQSRCRQACRRPDRLARQGGERFAALRQLLSEAGVGALLPGLASGGDLVGGRRRLGRILWLGPLVALRHGRSYGLPRAGRAPRDRPLLRASISLGARGFRAVERRSARANYLWRWNRCRRESTVCGRLEVGCTYWKPSSSRGSGSRGRAFPLAEQMASGELAAQRPLRDRRLFWLFFEPSTRTRVSFESAMALLGGSTSGPEV